MPYANPLISPSLFDETEDRNGKTVYRHDCHNLPICKSYGSHFYACLAGANSGARCTHGEKMSIRILNDMNPNAIHRPPKPTKDDITNYAQSKS